MTAASPKIALCPGQGAQVVGMGKAWAERSTAARAVFDRADRVVADRLGVRLSELCFAGPVERLNQTDAAQPALYVAAIASWHGLCETWGAGPGPREAGLVAAGGLSLGEYTALHLSGAFSFEDGLELVLLRGRAMQEAADAIRLPDGSPGSGMVALIGADEAQARSVCEQAAQGEVLVPANFNAPGQIVVSGAIGACQRSVGVASGMGLRSAPLPVAGAFHSPLMRPAADRLAAALESTRFESPAFPVLSNVTGRAHEPGPGGTIAQAIRARLVEQLTHAVRWNEGCASLVSRFGGAGDGGVGGMGEFHELAPGKTLAGLFRRIDKSVKVETHDEPAA